MMQTSTPIRACICALLLALAACSGQTEADFTASAQSLLDKKDPKSAIIQLKNALLKNPSSGQARQLLGRALLESGDPRSAVLELRKARELKWADDQVLPYLARAMLLLNEGGALITEFGTTRLTEPQADAELQTALAAAYAARGEMAKADTAVAAALQARPGLAAATIMQAQLKLAAGDMDAALALLAPLLASDPGNERAGVLRADVLWHGKQDVAAALDGYRKVLAAQPQSVAAHTAIIGILSELKKPQEVKAQYELLKQAAPNHPETQFVGAQIAFSEKDYKATREITERILKLVPESGRALQLAGAAEFGLQQYNQAESLLNRALKKQPGLLMSRQLLAQTYLRTGRADKAIEVLQPVVDGKQPDGASLALVGEAYLQTGDAQRSEAAFQRAAKLAPQNTAVRTSVAVAQLMRGEEGPAIRELEAIAAGESGTRADLALISVRLKQQDLAGALKAIDGLERKTPTQPLAFNLRGRVQMLKRDLPGATLSFETALSKDPKFFPAVASLAAIDVSTGKVDAARKRFEQLIQLDPRHTQAKLALAELGARTGAQPSEVLALLREAVKTGAAEARPNVLLVKQLLLMGDNKGALLAARDATSALPANEEIMEVLGRAQIASGEASQAVITLTKLASLQAKNPLPHVLLADAHLVAKDNATAERELRKALELKPDLEIARRGLVSMALLQKRYADALAVAREMQKVAPKNPLGFSLEGDVEAHRKAWDVAIVAYKAALQRSSSAESGIRLHNALRTGGKTAEAARMAGDWIRDKPKDAAFRYYMGDVSLAQKDNAAAEAHYRAVLELQPRNAMAMNNVAWLMTVQRKPGAVALAQQAVALLPGRAALLDTLASALAAENQLPKAIAAQKQAVATNPKDPLLKLSLAIFYIKSGDKAFARAELEDLVKLGDKFPAQADVQTLLKSL